MEIDTKISSLRGILGLVRASVGGSKVHGSVNEVFSSRYDVCVVDDVFSEGSGLKIATSVWVIGWVR